MRGRSKCLLKINDEFYDGGKLFRRLLILFRHRCLHRLHFVFCYRLYRRHHHRSPLL